MVLAIKKNDWLLVAQEKDEEIAKIKSILESGTADENKIIFQNHNLKEVIVQRLTNYWSRWVVPVM